MSQTDAENTHKCEGVHFLHAFTSDGPPSLVQVYKNSSVLSKTLMMQKTQKDERSNFLERAGTPNHAQDTPVCNSSVLSQNLSEDRTPMMRKTQMRV